MAILNSGAHDTIKFKNIRGLIERRNEEYKPQEELCSVLEDIAIASGKKKLLAEAYQVHGIADFYASRYTEAITYLYKALPLAEDLKLLKLQSSIYNYLGIIASDQGNSKKAIFYFRKTYEIAVKTKDINQQFTSANNLGVDYSVLKVPVLAIFYLNKCKVLALNKNKYAYLVSIYGNLLTCYIQLQDKERSKQQLDSLTYYYNKTGKERGSTISLNHFSALYYHFANENKRAIEYLKDNLALIPSTDIHELQKCYQQLNISYSTIGDYENAYNTLIRFKNCTDSLSNSDMLQKSMDSENNYKNFKVEKELEIQKLNNTNKSLQLKRNKAFLILVSSLSLLLFGGIFFFYKLFRDKRRANVLLEDQKSKITLQKKEILDSIYYSKRIQEGILPTESELNQEVGEHFVLYKPKDIVSGDFYWASKKTGNRFLMACCDCTGHGVPGAFMSLVAYSLLNKIDESSIDKSPSEILNYLNIELPRFFKKEDPTQQIKDGMDMSLIEVDRANLKLKYSGANNSIYLIRKNNLQVIKADKQPISADVDMRKHIFKYTEADLEKGDLIVMFTDGYADQFGGPAAVANGSLFGQGKKFMYKRLEELLVKNADNELKLIKQKLETAFVEWQGKLEQIDDVCLIGIRI